MKHVGGQFSGGIVELDNNDFDHCSFTNVKLVYRGTGPVQLKSCEIVDCDFTFDGAAANTLLLIKAMCNPNSGFQQLISKTLEEIFHLGFEIKG
jgi:hypothetical protein